MVAEIQMGTVVRQEEPNYALLSTAAQSIRGFLESTGHSEATQHAPLVTEATADYAPAEFAFHLSPDPWNLEMGFWQELTEHPCFNMRFTPGPLIGAEVMP